MFDVDFAEVAQRLLVQMIPFLMAIVFHEFGHALVAKRYGDNTAEELGRLTLNPIPHLDPIGTVLFPMINMIAKFPLLFGWARPVPINYKKLKPYRRGLFLVSLAGPATNIVLAFFAACLLEIFKMVATPEFYLYEPLRGMAETAVIINLALAVFNLLPLPPLDGSKMIEAFLTMEQVRKFERLQTVSFFVLIALLWTGGLGMILNTPVFTLRACFLIFWRIVFLKLGLPVALN